MDLQASEASRHWVDAYIDVLVSVIGPPARVVPLRDYCTGLPRPGECKSVAFPGCVPGQGTPQGAVISPLLSTIGLDPLDHLIAENGCEMVRYADAFVVLCRTLEDAAGALAVVKDWTASASLTLHPTKTRLVDARTDGFDFLGYHFEAGQRWPNVFFADHGLFSLQKADDTVSQSPRG